MGLTCKLRPWDGWAPRVHSAGAGAHASEGHDHHPGGTHHSGGPAAADAAESPARCCDFSGQSPSTRVISPHTTCSSPTQEGQMPGATRARAGLPWCLSGEESAYQCRRRGVRAPVCALDPPRALCPVRPAGRPGCLRPDPRPAPHRMELSASPRFPGGKRRGRSRGSGLWFLGVPPGWALSRLGAELELRRSGSSLGPSQ